MKIQLFQTDVVWKSPKANRSRLGEMIFSSPQTDLIVLPEMFTTGFCVTPQNIAEEANTETLEWMQAMAKEKNAAICGSIATVDSGKYYNRLYFVKPDGSFSTYDKRHLFSFAGEQNEYEAGKERIIVEYKGFRILLQICYDLRFPVFSRNRGDYDVIIYIANWPITRIDAWTTLLKARAIENLCYVVGVNRVGSDPICQYNGNSVLLDYIGKTISAPATGKEEFAIGEIEIEPLNRFRLKFPALNDADDFSLKLD